MIPEIITAVIIIAVILIVLIIYVAATYNSLIRGQVTIEEAFSTMDVYLKKRFDMIPNLVETVKGYAKHEESTLAGIVKLRNQNYDSMSEEEKLQTGAAISQMVPKIMALAEAYPDLKANQNFLDLSSQLGQVENDIANARKFYNGAVKKYNLSVQMFPSCLIAGLFHFSAKKMYEVENQEERQNVQVKF